MPNINFECFTHSFINYVSELHLPTNWLSNFVRRQKLKYFGQVTRHGAMPMDWFREYNLVRNGSRENKPRKAKTNMVILSLNCNVNVNIHPAGDDNSFT